MSVAANWTWDWLVALALVGAVAVAGVRVTEIPESRKMVAVPVFLLSATDVAVIMTCRPGYLVASGTLFGEVKVTLAFAELAGMLPVSELQLLLDEVVGVPEELTVVVVYWQVQVTLTLVEPLTVAVSVMD